MRALRNFLLLLTLRDFNPKPHFHVARCVLPTTFAIRKEIIPHFVGMSGTPMFRCPPSKYFRVFFKLLTIGTADADAHITETAYGQGREAPSGGHSQNLRTTPTPQPPSSKSVRLAAQLAATAAPLPATRKRKEPMSPCTRSRPSTARTRTRRSTRR